MNVSPAAAIVISTRRCWTPAETRGLVTINRCDTSPRAPGICGYLTDTLFLFFVFFVSGLGFTTSLRSTFLLFLGRTLTCCTLFSLTCFPLGFFRCLTLGFGLGYGFVVIFFEAGDLG